MAQLFIEAPNVEERERWRALFLDAFAEGERNGTANTRLREAMRALPAATLSKLGLPPAPSDLQFFEFGMREGAKLLLLLEKP